MRSSRFDRGDIPWHSTSPAPSLRHRRQPRHRPRPRRGAARARRRARSTRPPARPESLDDARRRVRRPRRAVALDVTARTRSAPPRPRPPTSRCSSTTPASSAQLGGDFTDPGWLDGRARRVRSQRARHARRHAGVRAGAGRATAAAPSPTSARSPAWWLPHPHLLQRVEGGGALGDPGDARAAAAQGTFVAGVYPGPDRHRHGRGDPDGQDLARGGGPRDSRRPRGGRGGDLPGIRSPSNSASCISRTRKRGVQPQQLAGSTARALEGRASRRATLPWCHNPLTQTAAAPTGCCCVPGVIWGASFLFIAEALEAIRPNGLTFVRILVGFVTLALFPAAAKRFRRAAAAASRFSAIVWMAFPLSMFPVRRAASVVGADWDVERRVTRSLPRSSRRSWPPPPARGVTLGLRSA